MAITSTWFPQMQPMAGASSASGMNAGQASMQTGYALATNVLTDAMSAYAPGKLAIWQGLQRSQTPQILAVDGTYDHMHYILEASQIPHARLLDARRLHEALEEVPGVKALLINCARSFPVASAQRAARFVEEGGLLVTSDWALQNVLEVAFPGMVRHNGRKTAGSEFVGVQLLQNTDPFLSHAFAAAEETPAWWLEPASFPIERLSSAVDILLYSYDLKQRYGNGSVMVSFAHGAGRVYHMISHAFLQQRRPMVAGQKGASSIAFTTKMGTSLGTQQLFEKAEKQDASFDGSVAAATTISTAIFLKPLLDMGGSEGETNG